MKTISKLGLGVAGALALVLVQVAPAHADIAAQADDVVGVGSDTAQYGLNFLVDGDINGNTGFNNTSLSRRVFNFDASGDALNAATPNANIVMRANTKPRVRPNGSGSGIAQINLDTGATHAINFARSSRLPKASEQATAAANGWVGLHVYQFGTDNLSVAVSNLVASHAPTTITVNDLVNIYKGVYTTWGQIPGYNGSAPAATIHPVAPQTGSGTYGFFDADLKAANGGTAITYAANVVFAQEHDPSLIQNDPDALTAFSLARKTLLDSGYFGATLQNTIRMVTGAGTYNPSRGIYVLVRQTDVDSTTPWLPGGTQNWAKTLFAGPLSWMARASNASLIASAGFTPAYADLGIVSSG